MTLKVIYFWKMQLLEEHVDFEDIENINLCNYDEKAIAYFAGFVARRSFAKNNCENCRNDMMDNATPNEKYIEFREYSNKDEDVLTVTNLVRLLSNCCLYKYYENTVNDIYSYVAISLGIQPHSSKYAECVHVTNKNHTGWLDINHKCYNHRMEALKYTITVKIYFRTRYNNCAEKRSNTLNRKLKNILNKIKK